EQPRGLRPARLRAGQLLVERQVARPPVARRQAGQRRVVRRQAERPPAGPRLAERPPVAPPPGPPRPLLATVTAKARATRKARLTEKDRMSMRRITRKPFTPSSRTSKSSATSTSPSAKLFSKN